MSRVHVDEGMFMTANTHFSTTGKAPTGGSERIPFGERLTCSVDDATEVSGLSPETEYERRRRLKAQALLACNDRYYLLTGLLLRQDMLHPWLFSRCREVEAEPDGFIDLWARGHGKTSIITVAGTIQQVVCDPEITIAIFSATKPLAQEILGQIKN